MPRKWESAMRRKLGLLLLFVSSLGIAALVAEVCLRIAGHKPQLSQPFYLDGQSRVPDADMIMVNPKFRSPGYFNAAGSKFTIVTLGDSFTEGYPYPEDRSYPRVLERLLAERGTPVQVVNAGQGDTGPGQQLKLLVNYVLPRLKFNVLVWAFYANDILDGKDRTAYSVSEDGRLISVSGARHWLYRRQLFYDYTPLPSLVKRRSYLLNVFWKATELMCPSIEPDSGLESRELKKINLELDAMDVLSRKHGFRVIPMLIAPQARYLAEIEPDPWKNDPLVQWHRALLEALKKRPGFIDGTLENPYTRRGEVRGPTPGTALRGPDIFNDGTRDGNPLGDRHLSEIGYRLLAKKVADTLVLDGGKK